MAYFLCKVFCIYLLYYCSLIDIISLILSTQAGSGFWGRVAVYNHQSGVGIGQQTQHWMPALICADEEKTHEKTFTFSIVALPPFVSFFRFSVTSAFVCFLFSPLLLASLSFSLLSFSLILRCFTFFFCRLSRFLSVDVFSVSPRISPALFFSFRQRRVLLDTQCN